MKQFLRRALPNDQRSAALVADQRSRSARAWQIYRAPGAALAVVAVLGVSAWLSWLGGLLIAGIALVALIDALAHKKGAIPSGPFVSMWIDITLIAVAFWMIGIPRGALGIPFSYVLIASVMLLPSRQAALAVGYAAATFTLIPSNWIPPTTPDFADAQVATVAVVINLLFAAFQLMLVWSVFTGLVGQSNRHRTAMRYQEALATCSAILLGSTKPDALGEAARALLAATEADGVRVEELFTDDEGTRVAHTVASAGRDVLNSSKDSRRLVGVLTSTPALADALDNGRPVIVHTDQLTDADRDAYLVSGITTEALVPVMVHGAWAGSVSFVEYGRTRSWSPHELEALETAAGMFGSFWERVIAHRSLLELVEAKNRFIGSVSHELRTPLTAVLGLSQELEHSIDDLGSAEVRDIATIIASQSEDVVAIVEDLLVNARSEAGTLSVHPQSIRIRPTIADLVGRPETLGLESVVDVVGDAPTALADPVRLRQIVRNLLTNAARYGGRRVWVELGVANDMATIRVCDDGPGVPDGERERIFEPFSSADADGGALGSVGLGLAVARQLAYLMDGDLACRPHEGHTVFELAVPLARREEAVTDRPVLASV